MGVTAEQLANDQQFYNRMQRYRHASIAQQPAAQAAYLDVCEYVIALLGSPAESAEAPPPGEPGDDEPLDVGSPLGLTVGDDPATSRLKLEVAREVCAALVVFLDGFAGRVNAVLERLAPLETAPPPPDPHALEDADA